MNIFMDTFIILSRTFYFYRMWFVCEALRALYNGWLNAMQINYNYSYS